jgi:hypothetical protein
MLKHDKEIVTVRFTLPRYLRLEFGFLGEFSVCLTPYSPIIKVLLLYRVEHRSQFSYTRWM